MVSLSRLDIEKRILLLGLTGSRAYGTFTEDSDYDYKGVFIAPPEFYLGVSCIEQKDKGWDIPVEGSLYPFLTKDTVVYEMQKYINLLRNNNPNILELLFLPSYEAKNSAADLLLENRTSFFTKKVVKAYIGYAYAQMKKCEVHRSWLLQEELTFPLKSEFGLEDKFVITKSNLHRYLEYIYTMTVDKIEFLGPSEEFRNLLEKVDYKHIIKNYPLLENSLPFISELCGIEEVLLEKINRNIKYRNAIKKYKSWLAWKNNRNPERFEIEKKCGYDGKHLSHCLRLLRQGREIVDNKNLIVDRREAGDADLLKDIRYGKVDFEYVSSIIEAEFIELKNKDVSHLPDCIEDDLLNTICIEMYYMY